MTRQPPTTGQILWKVVLLLAGLCLGLLVWGNVSRAQVPQQCVASALAGGTGDALTVPLLPCGLTTNLLILTLTSTNTTTTPTLQMVGSTALPIVNNSGVPVQPGDLPSGYTVLLNSTGTSWKLMTSFDSFTGQLPLASNSRDLVFVQLYGAAGNGTVDDRAAFVAADAASTGPITVPPGTYRIASSVSLSHQLVMLPGALLAPDSGAVVTLALPPAAPATAHLFTTGAGTIHLTQAGATVYPEWWGAKADNSTASAPAWQAAANAVVNSGTVQGLPGFYQMACAAGDAVTVTTQEVNLYGAGDQATSLVPSTNCSNFLLTIAPSGQSGNIRDLLFNGSFIGAPFAGQTWGAIKCSECGISDISHVQIYGSARGIEGDFMEGDKLSDIECQGGAVFCYQFGGGPLDQTGAQHVSGLKLTALNAFNLGNSAGVGFIFDSGSSDIDVDRAWQGGDAGGLLIQNTFGGTGAHRPEGIRIGEYSNFSANTNYAVEVLSAWETEFKNGANANGTTGGPDIILGATSGSPTVDGFAMDGGAWAAGAKTNEIEIRAAANVFLRNSYIYDASNGTANTNEAVHVSSLASGALEITGNLMASGVYNNLDSAMAWSLVLDSGSLTSVGSFVGRLHVADNNMCGNSGGTIENSGAAPTGVNFEIDPTNLCDLTALASSRLSGVPNSSLATMGSKTLKGNATGGTAVPSDLAVATVQGLLSAGPGLLGFDTSQFYSSPFFSASSLGTFTLAANTLYAHHFYTPVSTTMTKIGVQVSTLSTGSCELGVYTANPVTGTASGSPAGSALLLDAGSVSVTGTGYKEITSLSIVMTPGWYWLAEDCTATPVEFAGANGLPSFANEAAGQATFGTANTVYAWSVAQASGALPGTFPSSPTGIVVVGNLPAIGLRL